MKDEKKDKKSLIKNKYFWAVFALSFLVLCLVGETVLAVLNSIISKGKYIAYTVPLYVMPPVAFLATFVMLYIIRRNHKKAEILIDSMNKFAAGDLNVKILSGTKDKEYIKIYENFNKMVEEISSVNDMRDDFINSFSHEIKTPLSSINGFANLVLDGGLDKSEEERVLKIIAASSDKLLRLTDNMLTLSRLENQKLMAPAEEVKLDTVIKNCIIMLETQWAEKNVSVSTDLLPVKIIGNKSRLSQVFLNLLSNAVKFTPAGGEVYVGMREENGFVYADVSDTGIGIAEDEINAVFDKYYRSRNAKNTEGSGLGLAICKMVCALHGGDISVKSVLNEGSTFTVKLPLNR